MKSPLSPGLIKRSLAGHSWIGLMTGLLLYIVCLSGTLAVFYPELERWEQADLTESTDYDVEVVDKALNDFLLDEALLTPHMYAYLPTASMPRLTLSNENQAWLISDEGELGTAVKHDWTHFLIDLHLYLTIPGSLGMVLVSALGAMLIALIVSGFLAHPSILKDAFKFRLGDGGRLQQVDIHNRLSVWGAPFHLLIAFTGAYFGLVVPMLGIGTLLTGDSQAEILAEVFGEEPRIEQQGRMEVASALEQMPALAPDGKPFAIVIHEAGSDEQFMEILARHEGRLIYSENYRFDRRGNYLGRVGYLDGDVGKQMVYSMYDLHFGHFSGLPMKFIYGFLGLALTIVSVTGVNIWLKKRNYRDAINDLWVGSVWGLPVALALTLLLSLALAVTSVALFWLIYISSLVYAVTLKNEAVSRRSLQMTTAILLGLVVLVHFVKFGAHAYAPSGIIINLLLTLTAIVLAAIAVISTRQPFRRIASTADINSSRVA